MSTIEQPASFLHLDELSLEDLLPEGTCPPRAIPADVFAAAQATLARGERLDMQFLAAEVGTSRSTLYRRVGGRDQLIGAVVWHQMRRVLANALAGSEELSGADRITWMFRQVLGFVAVQPAFQRMLLEEPQTALRVLTSAEGCVQPGFVAFTERVLDLEAQRSGYIPPIPVPLLAYVIVRIGEGFLYADLIAGGTVDVAAAVDTIGSLLGLTAGAPPTRADVARMLVDLT